MPRLREMGVDLMDFGEDRTSFPRQMKKNVTLYCRHNDW